MTTDISRLLAASWRSVGQAALPRVTVVRQWSLEMQWFGSDTAEQVLDALLAAGWLRWTADGLLPAVAVRGVSAPLGWTPMARPLLDPPRFTEADVGEEGGLADVAPLSTVGIAAPRAGARGVLGEGAAGRAAESTPPAGVEGASQDLFGLVLGRVAARSGLARQEVMRRADRKRRALTPCAPWLAVLLVGHEQGLEMAGLVAGTRLAHVVPV